MIITIDIDAIRKYMLDNSYAAVFVGDFGGTLLAFRHQIINIILASERRPGEIG